VPVGFTQRNWQKVQELPINYQGIRGKERVKKLKQRAKSFARVEPGARRMMNFRPSPNFRLSDWLDFCAAGEAVADALALGAVFVAVISGGVTEGTIFPVAAVGGAGVGPVAAFAGDGFAATAVGDPTVVARTTALRAMRNGEVSFQHGDMIRPRCGGS
jgi:hypothetical protein